MFRFTLRLGSKCQNITPWPVLTVNSEFFARVLFSRNFAYAKFREYKILAKSLCRLLIWVNHALYIYSHEFLTSQICLLTLFAKISVFTVYNSDLVIFQIRV